MVSDWKLSVEINLPLGMRVFSKRSIMVAMIVGGGLAGLGGAIETLGIVGRYEPAFNAGLGFDGITIALLGRANPLALIPGAILFGGMRGAGGSMHFLQVYHLTLLI
ncbi:MAG: hypothetical protein WDO06_00785 [Actinomycetota bacterium]